MHSQLTTDLTILHSNLKLQPQNQQYVVLIKTGALNPVHRCHIANMVRTKEYLERVHNFNVIGGYISPTHDEYVHSKLQHDFITAEHRIEMCRKAIVEAGQQNWLSVDMAECMAPRFIPLSKVTLDLQVFINQSLNLPKRVRVIYVSGLDLFNRCRGFSSMREPPYDGVAVVYRPGENLNCIQYTSALNDPYVFYVCGDNEPMDISDSEDSEDAQNISSTLIRERLKKNQSCENLTYRSVLDHLERIPLKKD